MASRYSIPIIYSVTSKADSQRYLLESHRLRKQDHQQIKHGPRTLAQCLALQCTLGPYLKTLSSIYVVNM